ncbi:hypothetical protein D3C86_436740 [compost metagenome]
MNGVLVDLGEEARGGDRHLEEVLKRQGAAGGELLREGFGTAVLEDQGGVVPARLLAVDPGDSGHLERTQDSMLAPQANQPAHVGMVGIEGLEDDGVLVGLSVASVDLRAWRQVEFLRQPITRNVWKHRILSTGNASPS